MAADKIDLEIVTPKGKALSVSVDEVTAPSVEVIGVRGPHAVVAAIRTARHVRQGRSEARRGRPRPSPRRQNKLQYLEEEYAERSRSTPSSAQGARRGRCEAREGTRGHRDTPETNTEKKNISTRELARCRKLEGPEILRGPRRPFEEWAPPPPAIVEDEDAK